MSANFNAKVMLSLYKNLPAFIKNNEKAVIKRSGFGYRSGKSTLELLNEIAEFNAEKVKLVNLKVLSDKALSLMLDEDRKIIYYRFVKNMKFCDIAKKTGVSIRQVFRAYDTAMESFCAQLAYLKYPPEKIEAEFGGLNAFKAAKIRFGETVGTLNA